MIRAALAALALLAALASPATALAEGASAVDWSGLYSGTHMGLGEGAYAIPGFGRAPLRAGVGGFYAGGQKDFGAVVVGAEVSYDLTGNRDAAPLGAIAQAGGRIGWDAGSALLFVSGGVVESRAGGEGRFRGAGFDLRWGRRTVGLEAVRREWDDGSAPFDSLAIRLTDRL